MNIKYLEVINAPRQNMIDCPGTYSELNKNDEDAAKSFKSNKTEKRASRRKRLSSSDRSKDSKNSKRDQ